MTQTFIKTFRTHMNEVRGFPACSCIKYTCLHSIANLNTTIKHITQIGDCYYKVVCDISQIREYVYGDVKWTNDVYMSVLYSTTF
jgi:hypothetical protein